MKFVFVSGGVVSGLGKGTTSASLSLLLNSKGISTTNVKVDMYLNIDAGTIRPQEHGEVFVTDDGIETDQDIGIYERFTGKSLRRENYITTGQIYKAVIDRERAFGYEGEDVEAIPHITDEIIRRIILAGKVNRAKVVVVELGGTAGEYQNSLFFEAGRILHLRRPKDVIHVHVTYLPFLKNIGELKSKPAQQSVKILNAMGIQPDFLITRSEVGIDEKRKEKLAVFCNLDKESIFDNPDLKSTYDIPLHLEKQKLAEKIIKRLGFKIKKNKDGLGAWKKFAESAKNAKKTVKIAMVGKYFITGDYKLADSYISVIEAVKQAAAIQGLRPVFSWIDSQEYEKNPTDLKKFDGVIVPQGWGARGIEGKIKAIKFVRENKIPFLGLCFGLQMAVIEFARNVAGFKNANTGEADSKTPYHVIHVMPDQAKYLAKRQYGGTIRLGAWPCKIKAGTLLDKIYKKTNRLIYERHRHRYEVNNKYRKILEKSGLIVSGTSPDGKLVEAIELKDHPFFVGTQFHPEYIAHPLTPHPIFSAFIETCTAK